jgi:hypothetical protein
MRVSVLLQQTNRIGYFFAHLHERHAGRICNRFPIRRYDRR